MVWNHSISALESTQTCAVKAFLKYNDNSPIKGMVTPRWEDKDVSEWNAADKGSFIHHIIEECVKGRNIVPAAQLIWSWARKEDVTQENVMIYMSMLFNALDSAWAEAESLGYEYKNITMSGIWKRKHEDVTGGVLNHWCKAPWKDVVIAALQCVYELQKNQDWVFSKSAVSEDKVTCSLEEVSGYIDFHDPVTGVVIDFKTGFKTWTSEMVQDNNQLLMYSLLYHAKYGEYPDIIGIFSIEQGKIICVPFCMDRYNVFKKHRLPHLKKAFNAMLAAREATDVAVVAAGLSGSAAFCPCELAEYCPYVS